MKFIKNCLFLESNRRWKSGVARFIGLLERLMNRATTIFREALWLFCFLLISAVPLKAFAGSEELKELEKEVSALKKTVKRLTEPQERSDYDLPSLQIRGFGHLQYDANSAVESSSDRQTNNFTNGAVDLFITSQVAKKLSFLNETLFEPQRDGSNVLDVERALLKYEFSDRLNLAMGRGHTALGYWNHRFHHGTWLYTTVDRPIIYRFEDAGGFYRPTL
ncbi:MAG: hypothetical protein HY579_11355 [Nitrospinae bacterium]|nr:hypothetical protein [Nitrospinota bacterium]